MATTSLHSALTFPVKIIIVEKLGSLRELHIKNFKEEDLYKKAGFKSANHFILHHKYDVEENVKVHMYGKLSGIAGQENRYELPPPLDNTLFFGNCILIKYANDAPVNMNMNEWNEIYSKLFGEFESLTEGDSEESGDSEEDIADLKMLKDIAADTKKLHFTKQGYVKDDFVVGDEEEEYACASRVSSVKKSKSEGVRRSVDAQANGKIDGRSKNDCRDECFLPTSSPENQGLSYINRSGDPQKSVEIVKRKRGKPTKTDAIERNEPDNALHFQGTDELKEESYE